MNSLLITSVARSLRERMRATLTAHGKKPSHWKLDDSVREEMENEQRQSTHQNHHREL